LSSLLRMPPPYGVPRSCAGSAGRPVGTGEAAATARPVDSLLSRKLSETQSEPPPTQLNRLAH
jgi:hypothetical protein